MKEQIEELWNIITTDCDGKCVGCEFENDDWCFTHHAVRDIYNAGYRKQKVGEWVDKPTGAYSRMQSWCSACGKHSGIGGIESNRHKPFCPNCGASMKGGAYNG
jgi:hypothetical protein